MLKEDPVLYMTLRFHLMKLSSIHLCFSALPSTYENVHLLLCQIANESIQLVPSGCIIHEASCDPSDRFPQRRHSNYGIYMEILWP